MKETDQQTESQNIVGWTRDAESERELSAKPRPCGTPLKGLMGRRMLPEELGGVRGLKTGWHHRSNKKSASRREG